MELQYMSALTMGRLIRDRKLGCAEAAGEMIGRIQRDERGINAYITVDAEAAIGAAEAVQERLDKGEALSPLAGVPIGLKDNICVKDGRTTCASRMLADYVSPYDATVVERLRDGGMVLLGKMNMDEFAMGSANETSFFGPVRNPWNTDKVPGGSSGGCAAAIAAGQAVCALGSDTGGSIRQPAAFCGLTAIKPTYGTVSRYGLIPCASSLDQIGPMGRDVQDCAAILRLIGGWDERDSTSLAHAFDFEGCFDGQSGNPVIGLPVNLWEQCNDPCIPKAMEAAARTMETLGARIVEVELPYAEETAAVYITLLCAEAGSNLARYDGIKFGYRYEDAENLEDLYRRTRGEGFGLEVKRRILLGSMVLGAEHYQQYYLRARSLREMMKRAYNELFERVDMLLGPVAPSLAPLLGAKEELMRRYKSNQFTAAANLCGLPAVALPCGIGGDGLPLGMQLVGRALEEHRILRAADAFQGHTDYHTRRPL